MKLQAISSPSRLVKFVDHINMVDAMFIFCKELIIAFIWELLTDTCDPTIEEHFRRSLGNAYAPAMSKSRTPSPPTANHVANNRGPVGGGQVNGGVQDPRVKLVSVSGKLNCISVISVKLNLNYNILINAFGFAIKNTFPV